MNKSVKDIFHLAALSLAVLMTVDMATSSTYHDEDTDNVADNMDACPGTAQLRKHNPLSKYAALHSADELSPRLASVAVDDKGCALDSDKDSIPDYLDYCPDDAPAELVAGVHTNGCPLQSDGDGTPDYRDQCPGTPRGIKTDYRGCPITSA
jgi:OOP family OmpA-OmpF porin